MPKVDHPNIGDVLEHVYLTATLTGVDGSHDTVNFTGIAPCPNGEDIPLFYHCESDSELQENGALMGAAGAFQTNDKVIIQCKILAPGNYEPIRVVGFRDIKPRSCFLNIQLLTYKILGSSNIDSVAFNIKPQTDCSIQLSESERMLKAFIGNEYTRLTNLSQCKYHYEGIEEGNEITRGASLYHFDNIWLAGGFDRIVRVVDHGGVAEFEFKIPIVVPGGGEIDLIGVLSDDLTKLYISLYRSLLYQPPTERSIEYFVYDLKETDGVKEWKLLKSGETPTGLEYIDNVITRDGNCGCWKGESEILEEYVQADTLIETDCWELGGSSYKDGKRVTQEYKTFSLHSESFVVSSKMEAFHMSPLLKDYAVCKAFDDYSHVYGGQSFTMAEWNCVCKCSSCGPPAYVSSIFDRQVTSEVCNGGWRANYDLFSGLRTISNKWGTFWSGLYHLYTNHYYIHQACPPQDAYPVGYGTSNWLNSLGFQDLGHGYTTCVYRNVLDEEMIWILKGDCGWDGSDPGHVAGGMCQKLYASWLCKPGSETMYNCANEVLIKPDIWTDVKEKRLLSPLEITLQYDEVYGWETVENAFISYDEKTDSLIRGLRFNTYDDDHNKHWYWKILAKFPDCAERDITSELQTLLSEEHYNNIEAIIFI